MINKTNISMSLSGKPAFGAVSVKVENKKDFNNLYDTSITPEAKEIGKICDRDRVKMKRNIDSGLRPPGDYVFQNKAEDKGEPLNPTGQRLDNEAKKLFKKAGLKPTIIRDRRVIEEKSPKTLTERNIQA